MLTVQQIYNLIDEWAPFDTQADFDNAGLLLGDPSWEVRGIHVALDAVPAVVDEAVLNGANLIVTHHPLMFSARKRLTETDGEAALLCRMIRERIALIAVHTNWDKAAGGINDVLAAKLGLQNVTVAGDYLRVGDLPAPLTAEAFAKQIEAALGDAVRRMGPPDREIRRVGVFGGSGSEGGEDALALDAQGFVTGEMKHHHALAAAQAGMTAFEAGHRATEEPGIFALADALQNRLNALQWKVRITKSQTSPYG